jgi:hypothetical protein
MQLNSVGTRVKNAPFFKPKSNKQQFYPSHVGTRSLYSFTASACAWSK